MKTRNNNKGFSLVELIVVVAIMAVLVGVLAPAYLRYVEKSRFQKDISAIGEVVSACEVALADEEVYKEVGATTKEISLTPLANTDLTSAVPGTYLNAEVSESVPNVTLSSKTLTGATIKISVTASSATVAISAGTSATDAEKADIAAAVHTINGTVPTT